MTNSDNLFRFGNYEIPSTLIAEGGYEIKPSQRQDLDPFTDQEGYTHRHALAHGKTEVSITTRENLSWAEFNGIISGIRGQYANWNERDNADCEYFDVEKGEYSSGHHMYLKSSQSFTIKTYKKRYPSITLTFVEY